MTASMLLPSGRTALGHQAPRARPAQRLRWRGPWWTWQLLSCVLATALAPTFLPQIAEPMVDAHGLFAALIAWMVPSAAFAVLSFLHAGALHAELCFEAVPMPSGQH